MRSSSKGVGLRGDALSVNKKYEPFFGSLRNPRIVHEAGRYLWTARSKRTTRHMLCRVAEQCVWRGDLRLSVLMRPVDCRDRVRIKRCHVRQRVIHEFENEGGVVGLDRGIGVCDESRQASEPHHSPVRFLEDRVGARNRAHPQNTPAFRRRKRQEFR